MLRRFFIWIVKSLITLVLITLIFSTVALELPSLVKGTFSDIFQYASPEAQKEVVNKLSGACSALNEIFYHCTNCINTESQVIK